MHTALRHQRRKLRASCVVQSARKWDVLKINFPRRATPPTPPPPPTDCAEQIANLQSVHWNELVRSWVESWRRGLKMVQQTIPSNYEPLVKIHPNTERSRNEIEELNIVFVRVVKHMFEVGGKRALKSESAVKV